VKRDQEMQKFLDTFEERKQESMVKNTEAERTIVGILENIGVSENTHIQLL
jgi:hypothetical protein